MTKTYKRYAGGGRFQRTNLGDPTGELRIRDQNIIDAIKLSRKQNEERSNDLIRGQERADRIEADVSAEIEALEQKKYQTRLQAVKLRGRQEGQKGKDLAAQTLKQGEAWGKFSRTLGSELGKLAGVYAKNAIAEQQQKEDTIALDNWKSRVGDLQYNAQMAEAWKDAGGDHELFLKNPLVREYIKNSSVFNDPDIKNHRVIGRMLQAEAPDIVDELISDAIQSGTIKTSEDLSAYLNRNYHLIFNEYDVGNSTEKEVTTAKKTFKTQISKAIRKYNNEKANRLNTKTAETHIEEMVARRGTPGQAMNHLYYYANNHTQRIPDAGPNSKIQYTIKDGLEKGLQDYVNHPSVTTSDIENLFNQPWINVEAIKDDDGNITGYKKVGINEKGESLAKKFPGMKEKYLDEKKKLINKKKDLYTAKQTEADLTYLETNILPMIDGDGTNDEFPSDPKEQEALLTKWEKETLNFGDNSKSKTVIAQLRLASLSNYNDQKSQAYLQSLKENEDWAALMEVRGLRQLSPEKYLKFTKKWLPELLELEKSGFHPVDFEDRIKEKLEREAGINSLTQTKPISIDSITTKGIIRFHEIRREIYEKNKDMAQAIKQAETIVFDEITKGESIFERTDVLSEGDGIAEYKQGLSTWNMPQKGDPNYILPLGTFEADKATKGTFEATVQPHAMSINHLLGVQNSIENNGNFIPSAAAREAARDANVPISTVYKEAIKRAAETDAGKAAGLNPNIYIWPNAVDHEKVVAEEYSPYLSRQVNRIRDTLGLGRISHVVQTQGRTLAKTIQAQAALDKAITFNTLSHDESRDTNWLTGESSTVNETTKNMIPFLQNQGLELNLDTWQHVSTESHDEFTMPEFEYHKMFEVNPQTGNSFAYDAGLVPIGHNKLVGRDF